MIGQGFPLLGQPLTSSSSSRGQLRPAPMPFQPPIDFPMRGGGVQQLPPAATPGGAQAGFGGVPGGRPGRAASPLLAGPGGRPGGRGGQLGARSPVLNPFDRPEQRRKAGSLLGNRPVFGVR